MVNKEVGKFFLSECEGIVWKGKNLGVEITSIAIEGVYKEEIFRYPYTPEEEGYGEEGEEVKE